jgi:hypothetical protein
MRADANTKMIEANTTRLLDAKEMLGQQILDVESAIEQDRTDMKEHV